MVMIYSPNKEAHRRKNFKLSYHNITQVNFTEMLKNTIDVYGYVDG